MKTHLAMTALVAVLGASSASAFGVGDVAPNFKFEKAWNTTANQTQLEDYRGKLVLVEAWATW
ncbi:MAG: hypothetical protein KF754_03125 [Planctomycetes bacterium]|nr:hypothetical protein [Planctomycetota bacterium]